MNNTQAVEAEFYLFDLSGIKRKNISQADRMES